MEAEVEAEGEASRSARQRAERSAQKKAKKKRKTPTPGRQAEVHAEARAEVGSGGGGELFLWHLRRCGLQPQEVREEAEDAAAAGGAEGGGVVLCAAVQTSDETNMCAARLPPARRCRLGPAAPAYPPLEVAHARSPPRVPSPYPRLALALHSPCTCLALALHSPCTRLALALPSPCTRLALALHSPCTRLAGATPSSTCPSAASAHARYLASPRVRGCGPSASASSRGLPVPPRARCFASTLGALVSSTGPRAAPSPRISARTRRGTSRPG